MATRRRALTFFQSGGLLSGKDVSGDEWNSFAPDISVFQREASRRLFAFNKNIFLDKGIDLFDMKSKLSVHARSFSKDLETFSTCFFHPRKGMLTLLLA